MLNSWFLSSVPAATTYSVFPKRLFKEYHLWSSRSEINIKTANEVTSIDVYFCDKGVEFNLITAER